MNSKLVLLEPEYSAELDSVNREDWYKIISHFSDANIYQTWDYDAVRCGEKKISHFILKKGDNVIAAAQARIINIPFLRLGVAYIRWGPMWQFRNKNNEPLGFRMALRALRNEYVCKRGLILRIFPILYDDNSHPFLKILKEEGYTPIFGEDWGRTIVMDISQPLEVLRKKMNQKWRNCLNKAEKNNLEVVEGTDDNLFKDFIDLYRELLQRKKFPEPNDINEFRKIQKKLPPEFKMKIFLCRSNEINSAGGIYAAIGETGIYLFGATNKKGMENKGSYLLQWKAIQWMKNNGCKFYNLNGINPQKNPGTYHFKVGLSGKSGRDVFFLGIFDCYPNKINAILTHVGDFILPYIKKVKAIFRL